LFDVLTVVSFSHSLVAESQIRASNAIGRSLVDLLVPSQRAHVAETLSNCVLEQRAIRLTVTLQGQIELLLCLSPLGQTRGGQSTGLLGVCRNMSEESGHRHAHLWSEDDFSRVVERANAPIFSISVDGTIRIWNGKISRMTGQGKTKKRSFADKVL